MHAVLCFTPNSWGRVDRVPMSTCYSCGGAGLRSSMRIREEGVPPGQPNHNIVYRLAVLFKCPRCHGGQIERLDHDCFDFDDTWDVYDWYVLSPLEMAEVLALIALECPTPASPRCVCLAHEVLRELPPWHESCGPRHGDRIHGVALDVSGPRPLLRLLLSPQ